MPLPLTGGIDFPFTGDQIGNVIERDLGLQIKDIPGAGAAGGLGAGLLAFLGARIQPGIDIISEAAGLAKRLKGAQLVFTGEGRMDGQTVFGKTAIGVAQRAKALHLPVIAVVADIGGGYQAVYGEGIEAVMSIAPGPISFQRSVAEARGFIADAAERAMRLVLLGRNNLAQIQKIEEA